MRVEPGGSEALVESFDALYGEHHKALHAFFVARTSDGDGALDLLQELFTRLWRNMPGVAAFSPDRQRAWLFTVARNLVTDHFRAHRRRTEELPVTLAAPGPQPDELQAQKESVLAMSKAMQCLPEDHRVALVMSVLGEMDSGQIAAALGKPRGTIRYWISMARKRLAEELAI